MDLRPQWSLSEKPILLYEPDMKRNVPNLITCLNLLTGTLGCVEVINSNYHHALLYAAIAGVFDFFDGFAARLLHVKSDIGKELDSLADMVSFGLLPGLFMMRMLENSDVPAARYLGLGVVVFSALRLAKFNVDTRQSEEFIGLPTPANTFLLTSLVLVPVVIPGWILIGLVAVSCFLLVSPFRLLALKFQAFRWKGNELRFSFLLLAALLLGVFQLEGIPYIIPVYLVVSMAGNFFVNKSIN